MILAENGKSLYRIVRGEEPALRHAADEMAKYLEKMTRARLEIGSDVTGGHEIVIEIDSKGLKNDGYRLHTEGNSLYITGENGRGALYGVYGLLEKHLGCRFLAQDVETIPTLDRAEIPSLDETFISPLEYRETFWYQPEWNPDFAMKRGFNAQLKDRLSAEYGGGVRYWGFAHTLFDYVSPDEYFDEHPEYFAMVDGKRLRDRTQLCLTNPDVLAITRRKLRQNIIDHPECKIFSLTQMDWYNPCTCPECARIDAEEGAHSGTMIRFVNACAASIADEFPDVLIDTFAYQYTRQPPKITRPLPNVCVRLCSIECCRNHPVSECSEITNPFKNKINSQNSFRKDLMDWAKICKRVFVWDYTTNFRYFLAPFPNFHTLKANIRFFLENGVTGLFEQGNAQAASGEFGELRAYMIGKLMWNPDEDEEKLMMEFLEGYYGKAAAPIREYIRLLTEDVPRQMEHIGIYEDPDQYLSWELLDKADRLWDEAEARAEEGAELERVRKSRLSIRFARARKMNVSDPAREAYVEELIRDIRHFGIERIRESQDLDKSFEVLRKNEGYDKRLAD